MCENCRLMELFDRELDRCEVYEGFKTLAIALHLYAIERRDRIIAEAREKEDREMYDSPAPPSREERIEKALSNTTPYLSQDVIVPVEKLEAGRYRMMIPVEISTTGGLLLDRRDGLHGYSLEDYPNARFFKGW